MATPIPPAGTGGGPAGPAAQSSASSSSSRLLRTTQVIVVGSVMFTFISYWKTAAVVLCDFASTSYYIGGIAESAIGKGAPWFILAVMLFSYAVCQVYVESCAMFVRGGVYRVVRSAMGSLMGKVAVAALLFDYILTGPISGVTAGQYLISLIIELIHYFSGNPHLVPKHATEHIRQWGSIAFAIAVTYYFYRQNLKGIHESSDKAFKIIIATLVMAVILISWCLVTIALDPSKQNLPPFDVDLNIKSVIDPSTGQPAIDAATGQPIPKLNPITGRPFDPLGFLGMWLPESASNFLRQPIVQWLSLVGIFGALVAFGHSILAMSGEETLAQVYRELEAPKLPNFRKAARLVFLFSLILTSTISFLAVMIIPDSQRMPMYSENLIGGLAMNVAGPQIARLLLNAFVVVVGGLILSGAINTAIIGSSGVLNRVAEDGVLPVWMQKPHPKYGTTYRILRLILGLQIFTIIASRGDVLALGEAYAFGVVWSFVFMTLSMVILRFRQPDMPREFRVPFNLKIGSVEIPLGLIAVFLVLLMAAIANLLTKEVATVAGLIFTIGFMTAFIVCERLNRRHGQIVHESGKHVEQFNVETSETVSSESLGLKKPFTKLVAIRSPYNLFMLEKALAETDPDTTEVVVMTAKVLPQGDETVRHDLDPYDQQLMTAVVDRAEKAGKKVKPLIVPTNNALHAVLKLGQELNAQEIILGASNKYAADEQMEQIALYWMNIAGAEKPLTVRLLSRDRDFYLDLAGGNRIPKISERQAKSVAELRAAGVGVDRVLLWHDGTRSGSDLFNSVLTMLDPQVILGIAHAPSVDASAALLAQDIERAQSLGRDVTVHTIDQQSIGSEMVELVKESAYDLVIVPKNLAAPTVETGPPAPDPIDYLMKNGFCSVFVASPPEIPAEVAPE